MCLPKSQAVPVPEKDTASHTQAASFKPNKAWPLSNSNLAERHKHPRQICSAVYSSSSGLTIDKAASSGAH